MILCSPSCGIAPNSRSGGEVLERELVTALRRGGDDPHVLVARHHRVPANITVERLRWGRGLRWWLMPYVMGPAIMRCWQRHRFDALRAHSALFLGPACEWVSRRLGVPWVAHIQHVDRPHPVEGWALRKAARTITISEFSKRQVVDAYGLAPEKIAVIPPGVDHETFSPRAPLSYYVSTPNLLYVGGLKARKRPLMLLDILARVPGATLTIVGDGPLRPAIHRRAAALGLSGRVCIYTAVPDHTRPAFYRAADVFLFPSALEGFGMPALEAMACGLPVVASDGGALPELVEYPWRGPTVHDMALRVRCLLATPDLARVVGQQNHQRSLAYSWERCAKEVRRVCQQAGDDSRGTGGASNRQAPA